MLQNNQLIGFGFSGNREPPTPIMAYLGTTGSTSTLTTFSFPGITFGVDDPTRRIYVMATWDHTVERMVNSMTIGGVTATRCAKQFQLISTAGWELWYADIPTGASGTVAVTMSGSTAGLNIAFYWASNITNDTYVGARFASYQYMYEPDEAYSYYTPLGSTVFLGGINGTDTATHEWTGDLVENVDRDFGPGRAVAGLLTNTTMNPVNFNVQASSGLEYLKIVVFSNKPFTDYNISFAALNVSLSASGTTHTWTDTDASIATLADDVTGERTVIAILTWDNVSTPIDVTNVTIGGVTATRIGETDATATSLGMVAYAVTGHATSTATIVATTSGTCQLSLRTLRQCRYTHILPEGYAPDDTVGDKFQGVTSVPLNHFGFYIGNGTVVSHVKGSVIYAHAVNATDTATHSWSGADETSDFDFGNGRLSVASKNFVTTTSSTPVCTPSAGSVKVMTLTIEPLPHTGASMMHGSVTSAQIGSVYGYMEGTGGSLSGSLPITDIYWNASSLNIEATKPGYIVINGTKCTLTGAGPYTYVGSNPGLTNAAGQTYSIKFVTTA